MPNTISQFWLVFLAARDNPSRHIEPARRLWLEPLCSCTPVELLEASQEELLRDRAEAGRLAYVASTRARDLLVVPACGDQPLTGWLEVLNPALYPADCQRAAESPHFGARNFPHLAGTAINRLSDQQLRVSAVDRDA